MNKKDKAYIESLIGDTSRKMPDCDGDGYPDLFDCDPTDPTKDGWVGEAWKRATSAAQTARRRIYRPAAVSGREAVSAVYQRAYGAGAAARRAGVTRVRRAKEFVRAPPAERARRIERGKEAFVKARKPDRPISDISKRIHEETARVARVARGFEEHVDPYLSKLEPFAARMIHPIAPPPPEIKWGVKQAKELGYGVAFRAPAAAVEMVGMLPGAAETIRHKPSIIPAAAAVGTYMMGKSLFRGITTEPGATAGELIGLGAISKGIPKVRVPTRAVRALPPLPKFPGLPKARALEGKFPTPKGLTPEKAIKFEAGMEVTRRLKYAGAPIERPLDFNVVRALKGKGHIVGKWIETHPKQKAVIAGSGAAWAQFKSARTPGDIDLYVADPLLAGKQMYAKYVKALGAGNVRITPTDHPTFGKSSLIETKTGGRWSHAIDLHELPQVGGVMELGLMTQKPVMIGGKRYVSAGELMQRKAASVLYPREPGTIGPKPHRAKDIADYLQETTQMAEKEFAAAQTSRFLRGRQVKTATETQRLITEYELHSGLYTAPAARAYAALPQYVKLPSYLIATYTAGAMGYPAPKYAPTKEYPIAQYPYAQKYPVAKKTAAGYPPYIPKIPDYPVAPGYPKPSKYPKTPAYPKVPDYPKTPGYPKTPAYPKVPPPPEGYYTPPPPPPYTPYTTEKKFRLVKDKKKRKVKAKKGKPKVAVGWKQKHQLITLETMFGKPPGWK